MREVQTCNGAPFCNKVRLGRAFDVTVDCKLCWACAHVQVVGEAAGWKGETSYNKVQRLLSKDHVEQYKGLEVNPKLEESLQEATRMPKDDPKTYRSRRYPLPDLGPCVYRGHDLNGYEAAQQGLSTVKKWAKCHHADKPLGEYVCPCMGCGSTCNRYAPSTALTPDRVIKPLQATGAYNPSTIRFQDKWVHLYRTGYLGSDLWVVEMDEEFNPVTQPVKLELVHNECHGGREDGRFFVHNDKLHVAFAGVWMNPRDNAVCTSVLIAELDERYNVVDLWRPHLDDRQYPKEKNWSVFSHDGELFAVYWVLGEHIILKLDRTLEKAYIVNRSDNKLPWHGGAIRGGASPVRVGDRYYHWTHGFWSFQNKFPVGTYNVGLYTFEAKPPFKVIDQCAYPLYIADEKTRPASWHVNVVFPCGAELYKGKWYVTVGMHDAWTEILEWDHDRIKEHLEWGPSSEQ